MTTLTITHIHSYYDGPIAGEVVKGHLRYYWEFMHDHDRFDAWALAEEEWESVTNMNLFALEDPEFQDLCDLLDRIRDRKPAFTFQYNEATWKDGLEY